MTNPCARPGFTLLVPCLVAMFSLIASGQQFKISEPTPMNATTSSATISAVPALVHFSGTLMDTSGKPLTGIAGLTFSLYAEQQGGSPLWIETQSVRLDANGRYSVELGAATSRGLPANLFTSAEARWLGIQVQGQPEQPRIMLLSVPYALKAADAATVGGLPPSAFVLAPTNGSSATANPSANSGSPYSASVGGTGTQNYIPIWTDNSGDLGNSILYQSGSGSSAMIGLNLKTPLANLDVNGTSLMRGLFEMSATGRASATKAYNSNAVNLESSAFNSGTKKTTFNHFQWQSEPVGNNTTNPAATLNLLYGTDPKSPAETGLNIASNGQITFASGQTFPGTGAITGVTSGPGLSGGGSSGSVTLSVPNGGITNDMLQNSSLTVSAAPPLTGGGAVGLGGNTTVSLQACGSGQFLVYYYILFGAWYCQDLPNGIGGSGTTNYVPLWSSGITQGNSYIFQSTNGYVGIGTSSPATNLDVNGSLKLTDSGAVFIGTNSLGPLAFAFGSDVNENAFLGYAGLYQAQPNSVANTAVGWLALSNLEDGDGSNTALGVQALFLNQHGAGNTAVGAAALEMSGVGMNNTAVGYSALRNDAGGNSNTAVGINAGPGPSSPTLTNATAIGANAEVDQNNALILGAKGVNVGIGTSTPSNVFTIAQKAGVAISDGWKTYSSRRWKTNIQTLHGALGKVERLRGVSYDLKDSDEHEIGVIAEEVGEVVPEVVTWEQNGEDARGVDYGRLTALLIEATKEQQALIHKQQEQIRAQQAQITRLNSQVKAIQVSLRVNDRTGSQVHRVKAQAPIVRQ